jgi:HK97 family phage portal protein
MWFKKLLNLIKQKRGQLGAPRGLSGYTSGVFVNEDSALQVSAFHRGVTYITTQIAKLPWDIKDKNNKKLYGREYVLLNLTPNPEMDAMSFRLTMLYNAIIHGNAYAEIERNVLGQPIALWPIPTNEVQPYRLLDGTLVFKLANGADGRETYLRYQDIFHVKNFHTKNGLFGEGVVAYARDTLGISLGANQFASGLFANGGTPSGVIEVDGVLSDEAMARMKESWNKQHGGKKSGGTAILEQGAKYKAMSFAPDVMQFLESRKFSVLEVARFLGLPPTKLFDTDAATFNNMENANLEVATDTLDAWARQLEIQADIKILNNQYAGRYSELDLYQVFRGDMTTRANYFSKMMQSAALTPNEIREREGLAPYEGGDRYYVAVNNYSPADRIDEIVDAQIEKAEGPEDETSDTSNGEDQEERDSENAALARAAIKFLEGGKK